MRQHLFWFIISLFLSLLLSPVYAAEKNKALNQQQKLFLIAEKALAKKDAKQFAQLKQQLKDYPLLPYLEYANISRHFKQLPEKEIGKFMQEYAGETPLVIQLENQWLSFLASRKKWTLYKKYYAKTKKPSAKLQCYYLRSLLAEKQNEKAFELVPKLWLVGHSQHQACNAVFTTWLKNNTPKISELVFQRFELALLEDNLSLAKYLYKKLPKEKKETANLRLKLHLYPEQTMKANGIENNLHKDPRWALHGIKRLAKSNPQRAAKLWQHLQHQHQFTLSQQQAAVNSISRRLAITNPKKNNLFLSHVKLPYLTKRWGIWQVHYNLRNKNWSQVTAWIEKLPADLLGESVWRYWYARSLEQQGKQAQAYPIYQQLATERHFYGFLSAKHLGKPYAIKTQHLDFNKEQLTSIQQDINIRRAHELFALGRSNQAKTEWRYAIRRFDDQQKHQAAQVVYADGWPDDSLTLAARVAYQENLTYRFPALYKDAILQQINRYHLPGSLVFGMIRQESFFTARATSHAGARGLMQLMPATATSVARKIKQPLRNKKQLYNPALNIKLGTAYLNELLERYQEHPVLAIASYNAGPNRVKRWLPKKSPDAADIWIETIPWHETREYVKYVITYALIYDHLLGNDTDIGAYMKPIPVAQ